MCVLSARFVVPRYVSLRSLLSLLQNNLSAHFPILKLSNLHLLNVNTLSINGNFDIGLCLITAKSKLLISSRRQSRQYFCLLILSMIKYLSYAQWIPAVFEFRVLT